MKVTKNKPFVFERKKTIILSMMLVVVVICVGTSIWHSRARAANITYAKYNGVDYASVILDNHSIDDARYYALLKAQQMVTVQWTSPITFPSWLNSNGTYSTTKATDGTSSTGSFLSGKTYVGIPYSMVNHSADDVKWMNKITSGVTTGSLSGYYFSGYSKPTTAYGADCSYFVYQALKAANTGYSFGYYTTAGIAGSGHYTKIASCSSYSDANVNELFAKLKPGDIALKNGHVMLYVGRSGNNFAFFEAKAPVTCYGTYSLSYLINNGYTFYKFNGFNDTVSNTNPYGYVSGAYQVYTKTGETLNIRGGKGVEYAILGEIPDLTKVIVTDVDGYWAKATYNGITGWISLLYCNYIGSASCNINTCIDYPKQNVTVDGDSVYLQGWTVDKHEISKVTYTVNNGAEVEMTLGSRPDVAGANPSYPSKNNSWTGNVPAEMLQSGNNVINIYAYCSTGKKALIGSRTVKYAGEDQVISCDTKICIDYPKQNITVDGDSVYLQGWTVDKHGISKVTYRVNNGAEVEMTLGSRPDVAGANPSYPSKNNSWTANISTSELSVGKNTIAIYAYCNEGKKITVGSRTVTVNKLTDTEAPIITDVQVTNKTANGYTVVCKVTDESPLSHVYFPTWTEANGQDDIIWGKGIISGNIVIYHVARAAHKNETEKYYTHIYAYDIHGNTGFNAVPGTVTMGN